MVLFVDVSSKENPVSVFPFFFAARATGRSQDSSVRGPPRPGPRRGPRRTGHGAHGNALAHVTRRLTMTCLEPERVNYTHMHDMHEAIILLTRRVTRVTGETEL